MKRNKQESVTRKEIVSEISRRVGIPIAEAQAFLESWMEQISDEVFNNGNAVNFKGFGRFEMHYRPAGEGRNPRTGEAAVIKARSKVKFIPATDMKKSTEAYL